MPFIVGYRTIRVAIEWNDRVDEIPYLLIIRMEDMGSVLMHMDAFDFFTIDIPAQLRTFVDDEAFLPVFMGEVGEGRAE